MREIQRNYLVYFLSFWNQIHRLLIKYNMCSLLTTLLQLQYNFLGGLGIYARCTMYKSNITMQRRRL